MPFSVCPSCGKNTISFTQGKLFTCSNCSFEYFHNVATAAGAIIEVEHKVLFIVRAMDPAKGKLALPGGFVDPGERAEDAVIRECREEISWEPTIIRFLASFPNTYVYKDVLYNTCDLFFVASSSELDMETLHLDMKEASSLLLVDPATLDFEDLAFESSKKALRCYLQERDTVSRR